jgi:EmrB/QacA subfamily drug resistance transporter
MMTFSFRIIVQILMAMTERIPSTGGSGGDAAKRSGERMAEDSAKLRGRLRIALCIIVACQLSVVLDATIMHIALPQIQSSLGFSSLTLSWVVNAYALAFGGLLLLGGRAGDLLGRRRVFIAGVCLFTVASFLGGFAISAPWLLAARAGQGIGAAFAAPSALALLATTFAEGPRRARALGVYAAASAFGMMLGLILGGVLTAVATWRSVLFINVPVGVAVVLLTPRFLDETRRHPGRFDSAGALTSTAGLVALVYGFIRAASSGWHDRVTGGAFVAAAVLLVAFVVLEGRAEQPIMPLRLLADRTRASTCVARLLITASMSGMMFFLTLYLQNVLGLSPVEFSLAILPSTIPYIVLGRILTPVIERVGAKAVMVTGAVISAISMAWLSRISDTSTFISGVLGPNVLAGVGMGFLFVATTFAALSGASPQETGAVSGMLQTMQQVGGSLGVAILVTVFGTMMRGADPIAGLTAAQQARHAMVHGMGGAFVAATVLALGVVVATLAVGRTGPAPTDLSHSTTQPSQP